MLNEAEKNYLKSMEGNPQWESILKKISHYVPEERYNPAGDNEENKIHQWIYRSGELHSVENLTHLLRGK